MDKRKQCFDELRKIKGSLSNAQVTAGNLVADKLGIDVFASLVGITFKEGEMKLSAKGLDMIKGFEGLRTSAYLDAVGIWTIGYGTIVYPNGKKVAKGDTCTPAEADAYKAHDLVKFEKAVNDAIKVPVTQNQYDAVVSITYNIGIGAITGSTLMKKLNAGDVKGAADQFLVWNKGRVNGVLKEIKGLTNRRVKEREYFLS